MLDMERILFNLTLNSRDIGGVKSPLGKIKHRVVIRTDALRYLSEEDKLFLLSNNQWSKTISSGALNFDFGISKSPFKFSFLICLSTETQKTELTEMSRG